ncbi:MAG: 3-dehydroquinate synthase [Candidatus Peregrinibacteria bacterium]
MAKIILKTVLGRSEIHVKRGLFLKMDDLLLKKYPTSRFVVIVSTNLNKIYGKTIKKLLPGSLVLTVKSGEYVKNIHTFLSLAERMIDAGITRRDVVIGFGGGMITDLAGFLASTYMRGVPFVAIPTTLLCMSDAAIGGKTGIDFKAKNMLGTFYPAKVVICDLDLVKTLPERELKSGLGEIIKYAPILDPSLFKDFEKKPLDLDKIITKCIMAKVRVIHQDPREKHLRKILNYGHTFGHALEAKTHYALTHGEAISIGMVISNRIAQRLGKQSKVVGEKIRHALAHAGLPTQLPKGVTVNQLTQLIAKDKKRVGDHIAFIIVTDMGKPEMIKLTPEELVKLAR